MENAVPCGIIIEEASDHNRVENDVQPEIKMLASCSSPGREKPSYVDDLLHIFDIADESSLDGEVGKRLNQMIPIPVSIVFQLFCSPVWQHIFSSYRLSLSSSFSLFVWNLQYVTIGGLNG